MPKVIRIFVSSPSDVESERNQLTKVVSELNATITSVAVEKGISLELVKWETHTTPALDPGGPQAVVTQQIGKYDTYDLFIGICGSDLVRQRLVLVPARKKNSV